MMSRSKPSISPMRDEIANLSGMSAWCNLIGGFFLILIWAAFEYVDEVMIYMYYAAPLITPTTTRVMLVLGILCLGDFVLDCIVWSRAITNKSLPKVLLAASALPCIIFPPVGTFFGIIKISLARKLSPELDKVEPLIDTAGIKQLLLLNALCAMFSCAFIVLFIPAFYILPLEFINDEELFWLRLNIYNLEGIVVAIYAALVAIIAISAVLVIKQKPGGRKSTW
ncbi:MAG: hypothetical protein Q6353_018480, partial [Candidatus Sigynarchaeum springense]